MWFLRGVSKQVFFFQKLISNYGYCYNEFLIQFSFFVVILYVCLLFKKPENVNVKFGRLLL